MLKELIDYIYKDDEIQPVHMTVVVVILLLVIAVIVAGGIWFFYESPKQFGGDGVAQREAARRAARRAENPHLGFAYDPPVYQSLATLMKQQGRAPTAARVASAPAGRSAADAIKRYTTISLK